MSTTKKIILEHLKLHLKKLEELRKREREIDKQLNKLNKKDEEMAKNEKK